MTAPSLGLPDHRLESVSTVNNDLPLPLLDTVLEHDGTHVMAQMPVSLAHDNFVRHHIMTGPCPNRSNLFGLSCVPLACEPRSDGGGHVPCSPGRTDLGVIEKCMRIRLDCARRRQVRH